jgi:hypothetical protein
MRTRILTHSLTALMIIGVLVQIWLNVIDTRSQVSAIRGTLGKPGLWRSANFAFGQQIADYLEFVNAHIPEDAQVVLPPAGSAPRPLTITPNMQFFLSPREVINCTDLSCYETLQIDGAAFLAFPGIPQPGSGAHHVVYLPYDETWGIYQPVEMLEQFPGKTPQETRLYALFAPTLPAMLWVLLLTIAGALMVRRITPDLAGSHSLMYGFGGGLALFSLVASAASLADAPINRSVLILISASLLGLGLLLFSWHSPKTLNQPAGAISTYRKNWKDIFWLLVFLLAGGLALALGIGHGYAATDEILLWGAKGYGVATQQNVRAITAYGTNTLPYPLHLPVMIAAFRVLFADIQHVSKLIFAGYYLALIVLLNTTLLKSGLSRLQAGLGASLFAAIPVIFEHGRLAYANLPLAFYLIAGTVLLGQSLAISHSRQAARNRWLSGLMFVAAAWTRPEGIYYVLALIVTGLLLVSRKKWVRFALPLTIPLAIYAVFWGATLALVYSGSSASQGLMGVVIRENLGGNLHLNELGYILRSAASYPFSIQSWGIFGLACLLMGVLGLVRRVRLSAGSALWLVSSLATALVTVLIYYAASYTTENDISWWVSTGLERMMFPSFGLLWVGLVTWGLQTFPHLDQATNSAGERNHL